MSVIAATGHRPNKLGGYGEAAADRLFRLAKWYLNDTMPDRVISGMALGWDQAFARAAAHLRIPFTAAVPFRGQDGTWPPASRAAYSTLLALADAVVVVSDGGYSGRKMMLRNQWMVDNCDVLCAVWDGSAGGTSACVGYAKRAGRVVDNIHGMLPEFT